MKQLLLFTKKFPYSHKETYLFDELPFLLQTFDKVIIVPHDEFKYDESENRVAGYERVEIFKINNNLPKLSLVQAIKRQIVVYKIMLFELFFGRDTILHLQNYVNAASQIKHSYASAIALNGFMKSNKIFNTVYYCYWLHRGVLLCSIANMLSDNRKKIISRAHSYDLYHKNWFSIFPFSNVKPLYFETWKVRSCDVIYTISNHGADHLKNTFRKYADKIKISRLGVEQYEQHLEKEKPDNELTFVSCSSITNNKRIYLIAEILSHLDLNYKWIHFGGGDDEEVAKIEEVVRKNNMEKKCHIAGNTAHEEVLNFYKNNKVDLIFNVSLAEGIPVALMEAASFGIPMFATNTVGNPEIVNNKNGFLVEVNFNPEDAAKSLQSYFQSEAQIDEKRKNAYSTFENMYNAENNYRSFSNELLAAIS